MKVVIKKSGFVLGKNVKVASTFLERLIGLMFKKEMKDMDGLLIENCKSIHNSFMFFAIDAVFVDHNNKVVKILRSFKPWRWSLIYLKAKNVIELPAGTVPEDLEKGDELEVLGV
ncbi:MAG: DUF192 domain-containing protein [Bacteriovoracaceae bacterium]|jgi:uncharacterized membrane protein (UPF0127 family)|nr:DUF192 domain-containing protein [Bacteriovoracaceae bacterium]